MKILDVLPTPNPNAVKIVVGASLTPPGEVLAASDNPDNPLFLALSERDSIVDVMLQGSSITVVFDPDIAQDGREELHWVGNQLRMLEESDILSHGKDQTVLEDPTLLLIQEVLEVEILPYLESHGGSVRIIGRDGNEILLRYLGACGGCPASLGGTLNAIEGLIQEEIDPDLRIRLV